MRFDFDRPARGRSAETRGPRVRQRRQVVGRRCIDVVFGNRMATGAGLLGARLDQHHPRSAPGRLEHDGDARRSCTDDADVKPHRGVVGEAHLLGSLPCAVVEARIVGNL